MKNKYGEKYRIKICLMVVASLFLVLVVLCLVMCIRLHPSADGYLGLFGDTITGVSTLLIASISVFNENKAREYQDELDKEKRRNSIRANLQIEIILEDESIRIRVENHSKSKAIMVFFYNYLLFRCIDGNKTEERKVRNDFFNYNSPEPLINGYPEKIHLYYRDEDNNLIYQVFTLNKESEVYEVLDDCEYIDY